MYPDKISQAQALIERLKPELSENRPVYESILQFYSDSALVESQISALSELLKHKRINVYKASAQSFKECVHSLLDEHPELSTAKGMLRYYETTPNFDWRECEKAEMILGDALTQDTYGWLPDSWTVFEREAEGVSLTFIIAIASS